MLQRAWVVCGGLISVLVVLCAIRPAQTEDSAFELQKAAVERGRSPVAHWGNDPEDYTMWGTHTTRLVPVYTFGTRGAGSGVDLDNYSGTHSAYRDRDRLREIYGQVPPDTWNPRAEYLDQTDLARLQRAAVEQGKRHVFLVIFDGMDWQTTRAASIYRQSAVTYGSGRGGGLHFQDYDAGGTTQFGSVVTAPHHDGSDGDVDAQQVRRSGTFHRGGYDADKGGAFPWSEPADTWYPMGRSGPDSRGPHPYPDSAATATAMTSGVKTYNAAINVDPTGARLSTVAHDVQAHGWSIGVVTSVPISHATPAAAYAHNVSRNDYQDLTRDLLGLASVSHPTQALPGVDVLIGAGFGTEKASDGGQGKNFVPGNRYLTAADRQAIDIRMGGRYVLAERTPGKSGREVLLAAADRAAQNRQRLFGYFGVPQTAHLPFQTADGEFNPPPGRDRTAEAYTAADLEENPTLAEMTEAALTVLGTNRRGFWIMVEAGDVDWANHDNNLDNSIGAVFSGDDAVRVITDWVEQHSNWDESLLIVTADHGHYLVLDQPQQLIPAATDRAAR